MEVLMKGIRFTIEIESPAGGRPYHALMTLLSPGSGIGYLIEGGAIAGRKEVLEPSSGAHWTDKQGVVSPPDQDHYLALWKIEEVEE
jgi:hypothetical protein